jgi:tRNASer (uridine44-2'-O)-methyltransferase
VRTVHIYAPHFLIYHKQFDTAVSQLIHHPEYNSTLILRSETISDSETVIPTSVPRLEGYYPVRNVHRKLLPRRPGRDTALEQHCTLYAFVAGKFAGLPSTLVLTPLIPEGEILPYYHPAVSHLAFRFIPSSANTSSTLRMEAIPFMGTPTDLNSRLYRTALALLETLHRYLWGALTHYQKRVQHDVLIPREVYQDVYLKMRERHKGLVNTWKETTDPLKHVFEVWTVLI